MRFDLCIPVCKNLDCLRVAARGFITRLKNSKNLGRVLLHVQFPSEEEEEAVRAFSSDGAKNVEVVSRGPEPLNMSEILNRLYRATSFDWVVFSEQDVFLRHCLDDLIDDLSDGGYVVGGPLDTFHYSNPKTREKPLYGQYGRLSPEPGYFHSSLIVLKRDAVSDSEPFSVPEGFRFPGSGVLGAESYYGLREKISAPRNKLAFFTQSHCNYGYAADITWGGTLLATHLYYSGTKYGYAESGFLKPEEFEWLKQEELRFLRDYEKYDLEE